MHDEIAVPLGLTGTGYCEDGSAVPGRGRDYLSGRKTSAPTPYWSEPRFFAAGGLCSTVLDLVRCEKALEAGRVVSPAMLQAMRTPARLPSGLEADYGFGTRLGFTGGRRKLGHTGGGQSNKAVLARYPDQDVTVAVLLNTERANAPVTATDIEERVEQLFFDLPGPPPATPRPHPRGRCSRYAGQYRDGSGLVRLSTDGRRSRRGPACATASSRGSCPRVAASSSPKTSRPRLRFQTDGDRRGLRPLSQRLVRGAGHALGIGPVAVAAVAS